MASQRVENMHLGTFGRRPMFDDRIMLERVQSTHDTDEFSINNVKDLLYIVEDIFNSPTFIDGYNSEQREYAQTEGDMSMAYVEGGVFETFSALIDQIAFEIECKCMRGDVLTPNGFHDGTTASTFSILYMLSKYRWDSKLVLVLSSLATKFGAFLLIVQSYTSNPLTKSLAFLKQFPEIFNRPDILKTRFEKIRFFIKNLVDITKCVIEIYSLPEQYVTKDLTDQISLAVYWTIRGVLSCASQIAGITRMDNGIASFSEMSELNRLNERLGNMFEHLSTQLDVCLKDIDKHRFAKAYENIITVFDMLHIDNMKVLRTLFDPIKQLYLGDTKEKVNINVLKKKHVLIFISDLEVLQEELFILETIYNDSYNRTESSYEVVWFPVLGPTESWNDNEKKQQFKAMQDTMTWHIVPEPWLITPAVTKFIREKLDFKRKPVLIGLDPHGRIGSENAFPMMWIWGTSAYPFTSSREKTLWEEQPWGLDLLVDGVDLSILNWIAEGKYICLYGGVDIEWIKKFTSAARNVAKAANIPLEMVYVGKSNPKERVGRTMATVKSDKLSHCLEQIESVWFFWVRIASMWESRQEATKNETKKNITDFFDEDYFTKEITAMLSYGGSEQGWAVLSKGSAVITRGKDDVFLKCLLEYEVWKDHISQKGFAQALKDHILQLHTPHHCSKFVLPATSRHLPEKVVCAECGRSMEKFFLYECSIE